MSEPMETTITLTMEERAKIKADLNEIGRLSKIIATEVVESPAREPVEAGRELQRVFDTAVKLQTKENEFTEYLTSLKIIAED